MYQGDSARSSGLQSGARGDECRGGLQAVATRREASALQQKDAAHTRPRRRRSPALCAARCVQGWQITPVVVHCLALPHLIPSSILASATLHRMVLSFVDVQLYRPKYIYPTVSE